jgi:plastocyanin
MRKRNMLLVASLVATIAAATACSSSSSSSASSGASGQVTTGDASGQSTFDVSANNFFFSPNQISGTAGQKVTFHITNDGDTTHNFSIDDQSISENIDAGQSTDVQVTFPSSGTVQFYCAIHKSLGMTGELTVA